MGAFVESGVLAQKHNPQVTAPWAWVTCPGVRISDP